MNNIFKDPTVFNCMDIKNKSVILTPIIRSLDFQVWSILITAAMEILRAEIFAHIFNCLLRIALLKRVQSFILLRLLSHIPKSLSHMFVPLYTSKNTPRRSLTPQVEPTELQHSKTHKHTLTQFCNLLATAERSALKVSFIEVYFFRHFLLTNWNILKLLPCLGPFLGMMMVFSTELCLSQNDFHF